MTPQSVKSPHIRVLNNAHQFVRVYRAKLLVIMVIVGTPGYVPSDSIVRLFVVAEVSQTGWSGRCLA